MARTLNDPHRPRYHYLPPAQWLNDPNGLIQWRGQYHLFYQYADDADWRIKLWGHAASRDLVHWTDLPIALVPTPGGPDADGCWSGCAVEHNGIPTIVYSGARGNQQRPCVATSPDDHLLTWEKYPGNPVIAAPPADLETVIFRDHSVWNEGGTWYQVIGSGIKGVGGTALLYRSDDLLHWEYLHPLIVGDKDRTVPIWTGVAWECPDFFALDGKHVLVISAWDGRLHYAASFVGDYENQRFSPRPPSIVDGGHFYAPQVFIDERGRRVMFGWVREGRSPDAQRAAGWSGVMSLPRILSILPGGALGMVPAADLEGLRRDHQQITNVEIPQGNSGLTAGIRGDALELIAEFEPREGTACGLAVRRSQDGEEETLIAYNPVSRRLEIDARNSSQTPDAIGEVHSIRLDLAAGEPLRLHVFLDRSVLEVFANARASLTDRIYPSRQDSLGVELLARGGTARLTSLDAWQLASIWAPEEQ